MTKSRQVFCCKCGAEVEGAIPLPDPNMTWLCNECGSKSKGKRRVASDEELQGLATGNVRQGWYDE